MSLKLTKNSTIVLTSIILVLSIALGFLVWRVNQKETTAPTDTEAEGEGTSCNSGRECTEITCYWPYVSYCHNNACECRLRENQTVNPCTDDDPRCTPSSPGGNYRLCSYWNSGSQKMVTEPGCEDGAPNTVEKVCKTTCSSCNNPYFYQTRYILIEEEPACGDGTKDPGEACDPQASPTGCATGSTCTDNCTCNVDPYCGDGTLDTGEECENGDPTGVQCSWSACNQATCVCLPAGLNISKAVLEGCIDEGTQNPTSQLIYTITVTNTGEGIGKVRQIEDVLDSKIVTAGIVPSDITGGGVYSSGKILWSFSPSLEIPSGTTLTYSYNLLIVKENFGTYNNIVTLTPESGDAIQATANIEADCLVTTPQTGIFDSTLGRISVGFVLLLLGGLVYNLPSSIFSLNGRKNKFKYRVKFETKLFKK